MEIPQRLLEDAFWELDNEPDDEILQECQEIAGSKEYARQLYIKVRAMHFMMLEKKHRLEETRELVKAEELWDQMKKDL
jgi:methylphosphotriester-DNA--protein-cysteine methyltransferase